MKYKVLLGDFSDELADLESRAIHNFFGGIGDSAEITVKNDLKDMLDLVKTQDFDIVVVDTLLYHKGERGRYGWMFVKVLREYRGIESDQLPFIILMDVTLNTGLQNFRIAPAPPKDLAERFDVELFAKNPLDLSKKLEESLEIAKETVDRIKAAS